MTIEIMQKNWLKQLKVNQIFSIPPALRNEGFLLIMAVLNGINNREVILR